MSDARCDSLNHEYLVARGRPCPACAEAEPAHALVEVYASNGGYVAVCCCRFACRPKPDADAARAAYDAHVRKAA